MQNVQDKGGSAHEPKHNVYGEFLKDVAIRLGVPPSDAGGQVMQGGDGHPEPKHDGQRNVASLRLDCFLLSLAQVALARMLKA